jgi:ribosomal-protein-alanine N-acetyltransferase
MGPTVKLTNNLILRVEDETKAAMVLDLYERNRECFDAYEPTRPDSFYTKEYHVQSLRREYKAYMLGSFLRYYIYSRFDDRQIIGAVNFNMHFDGSGSYAEIGYKIDKAHQNRGYAFEACQAGIDIVSRDYNIYRIDARIHPDNIASLCLAQRLGFRYLSFEPQSANIMGRYMDLIRYSLVIFPE